MKKFCALWLLLTLMACASGGGGPVVHPPVDPQPPVVDPPVEEPQVTDLIFVVRSTQGKPIANALIVIDGGEDRRTTDGSGFSHFSVRVGAHPYVISALGYKDALATADVTASTKLEVQLTLDRPQQVRGRLQARVRALVYPDGVQFRWRFATGFRLLEQIAHGREAEAERFLGWARATGFNGVRVLCMANGLFKLTPTEGVRALPKLLALAAEYDLYVELVALADTKAYNFSLSNLTEQVRAVSAVAAKFDNALVQVANEHWHPTQVDALHNVATVKQLTSVIPAAVLYTMSAPHDDEAVEPQGEYITRHLDRKRDVWNQLRRVREMEVLSNAADKPVIDDEPIGADELDGSQTGKQRFNNPDAFFLLGVLGRVFEVGSTFHFQAGLFAEVPGPRQQLCAEAFIQGATLMPDAMKLGFRNATWPDSPVKSAKFIDPGPNGTVIRVYTGVSGNRGWTVALGLIGDPGIVWQLGWKPVAKVVDRKSVDVWEIVK